MRREQPDLSSPQAVRNYLTEQNITLPDATTDNYRLVIAQRRVRRLQEELTGTPQRPRRFADALSVTEARQVMAHLQAKAEADNDDTKCFKSMKGIIIEYSEEFVKLKHQVANMTQCRGIIRDGVCTRCHGHTPGVAAFAFTVVVQDMDNTGMTQTVTMSDKGGRALFNMSPEEFDGLGAVAKRDILENIEDVPVGFRLIMSYDLKNEHHMCIAWGAEVLPPPTV